jgi:hypothetical protein
MGVVNGSFKKKLHGDVQQFTLMEAGMIKIISFLRGICRTIYWHKNPSLEKSNEGFLCHYLNRYFSTTSAA